MQSKFPKVGSTEQIPLEMKMRGLGMKIWKIASWEVKFWPKTRGGGHISGALRVIGRPEKTGS